MTGVEVVGEGNRKGQTASQQYWISAVAESQRYIIFLCPHLLLWTTAIMDLTFDVGLLWVVNERLVKYGIFRKSSKRIHKGLAKPKMWGLNKNVGETTRP